MSRELGVATSQCQVCGNQLHSAPQPDGSVAATACSNCHPSPELASRAQSISRELGTPAETFDPEMASADNNQEGNDHD